MVWIVPSRERPHKTRRLLEACRRTGMSTPLVVVIDETDPQRSDYEAIGCALLVYPGESAGCAAKCQHAFERYSNLLWYGFLMDDMEPMTPGWDRDLSNACRPDMVAFCRDGLPKNKLATPVIGGDLLRSVGFVAPAGLKHYGGDLFWRDLAKATKRGVFLDHHEIRMSDRVAGESETTWDAPKRIQKARQHEDQAVWDAFIASGEMKKIIDRLNGMDADAQRPDCIPPWNWKLLFPIHGFDSMLELGNKRWGKREPYKRWFERIGMLHVSVDLNGQDGALKRDLRQPLDLGEFDMVTNFGTTEHVSDQEPVWRNVVESCRNVIVSTTPKPGTYKGHGMLYPTMEFYTELARLNGFELERLYEEPTKKGVLICARLSRRGRVPFKMPDASLIVKEADRDQYTSLVEACA